MGLFNRAPQKDPSEGELQQQIVELVMNRLTEKGNRIRAEDAICGAAAIVAERCIDAAGDYPLRDHTLPPGRRVFSDRANQILCGDTTDGGFEGIPPESVFGWLKAGVNPAVYTKDQFPDVAAVFRTYAAGVGKAEDWGKAPLSVPEENHPRILPLRFAYETRAQVDAILQPVAKDQTRCLRIATGAPADLLNKVAGILAPNIALCLVLETVNGMAKTAPMTEKALRAAQNDPPAKR